MCSRPKSLWKIGTPHGPISFSRGFFWQTLTPWLPPTMSRLFWTPSKLAKLFFLNIYFWLDYALCIFFIAHMYVIYLSYPIQGEKEEVLRRGRPSVWTEGFIGLRESILPRGPAKRPGLLFFIFKFFCILWLVLYFSNEILTAGTPGLLLQELCRILRRSD